MVFRMDPYSCLLFSMCSAYADLGLLVHLCLLCKENLAFRDVLVLTM
jgi:hypothetical protein